MTHRTNPSGSRRHVHGFHQLQNARMVDHYIGSSFDIVYAVYKNLNYLPPVVDFIHHWIPKISKLSPKVDEVLDTTYPDILLKHENIILYSAQTEQYKSETESLKQDTLQALVETENLRDECVSLKNQTESFKDQAEVYAQQALSGFGDLNNTIANTYVPKTIEISAGNGLTGGGNLAESRELSVVFGNVEGSAAQGNDPRIVNAVPNTRRIDLGTGLVGEGTLENDLTISLNFGSDVGTVAAGNDIRLHQGSVAHSWGNHATEGYLKTVTYGTTANTAAAGNDARILNGDTAHSWGNHATAGYVKEDTTYVNGTGLNLNGNAFSVKFGTEDGTVMVGNDARLTGALIHISTLQGQIIELLQRVAVLENSTPSSN